MLKVAYYILLLGWSLARVRSLDICKGQDDGVRLAHPNDCSRFIQCYGGETIAIRYCPFGLHFNRYESICDFKFRAGCDLSYALQLVGFDSGNKLDCNACRAKCSRFLGTKNRPMSLPGQSNFQNSGSYSIVPMLELQTSTPCVKPSKPTIPTPCSTQPTETTTKQSKPTPCPTESSQSTRPTETTPCATKSHTTTATTTSSTKTSEPTQSTHDSTDPTTSTYPRETTTCPTKSSTPTQPTTSTLCPSKPSTPTVSTTCSTKTTTPTIPTAPTPKTTSCPLKPSTSTLPTAPTEVSKPTPCPTKTPSGSGEGNNKPNTSCSTVTCTESGKCAGKKDGTLLPDNSKDGYIVCKCECEIKMPCPAGLVFNSDLQICDWPQS